MKAYDHDIPASHSDLKKMPYSVPEGYFESFKTDISKTVRAKRNSMWKPAASYTAAAASLALLLTLGVTLSGPRDNDDITPEEYILFSDNMINTSVYEAADEEQMAEAELMDEDIIQYQIYAGITPEMIELAK